jgi:hypothetical protein
MSVNWGGSAHPGSDQDHKPAPGPAIDASSAWVQLADTFPEWTLEPPLVLAPRRPPSS